MGVAFFDHLLETTRTHTHTHTLLPTCTNIHTLSHSCCSNPRGLSSCDSSDWSVPFSKTIYILISNSCVAICVNLVICASEGILRGILLKNTCSGSRLRPAESYPLCVFLEKGCERPRHPLSATVRVSDLLGPLCTLVCSYPPPPASTPHPAATAIFKEIPSDHIALFSGFSVPQGCRQISGPSSSPTPSGLPTQIRRASCRERV